MHSQKLPEKFAVQVSVDYVKEQKRLVSFSFLKWSKWMQVGVFFETKTRKSNGISDAVWEIKGFNKGGQVIALCRKGLMEGQTFYIWLWDMPRYRPADYTPADFSRSCYSCAFYATGINVCMALKDITLLGAQTNCLEWEA